MNLSERMNRIHEEMFNDLAIDNDIKSVVFVGELIAFGIEMVKSQKHLLTPHTFIPAQSLPTGGFIRTEVVG